MSSDKTCNSTRFKKAMMELSEEPMNLGNSYLYSPLHSVSNTKELTTLEEFGPWNSNDPPTQPVHLINKNKLDLLTISTPKQSTLSNRYRFSKSPEIKFTLNHSLLPSEKHRKNHSNDHLDVEETFIPTLSSDTSEKEDSKNPSVLLCTNTTPDAQSNRVLTEPTELASVPDRKISLKVPERKSYCALPKKEHYSKFNKSVNRKYHLNLSRAENESNLSKRNHTDYLDVEVSLPTLSSEMSDKGEGKSPKDVFLFTNITPDSQGKHLLTTPKENPFILEPKITPLQPFRRLTPLPKEQRGRLNSSDIRQRIGSLPVARDLSAIENSKGECDSPLNIELKNIPNLFLKPSVPKKNANFGSIYFAEKRFNEESREGLNRSKQKFKISTLLHEGNTRQLEPINISKDESKTPFKDLFSKDSSSSPHKPSFENKKDGILIMQHKKKSSRAQLLDSHTLQGQKPTGTYFSLHKAWRVKKSALNFREPEP